MSFTSLKSATIVVERYSYRSPPQAAPFEGKELLAEKTACYDDECESDILNKPQYSKKFVVSFKVLFEANGEKGQSGLL